MVPKYLTSDHLKNWGAYYAEKVSAGFIDVKFCHNGQFNTPISNIFVERDKNLRDEKLCDSDMVHFLAVNLPKEPFTLQYFCSKAKISHRLGVMALNFAITAERIVVFNIAPNGTVYFKQTS